MAVNEENFLLSYVHAYADCALVGNNAEVSEDQRVCPDISYEIFILFFDKYNQRNSRQSNRMYHDVLIIALCF